MELYPLDSLLRRTDVIDDFESLVWAERWRDCGDFELEVKATLGNRTKLYPGTKLALNESMRVMIVESVEDSYVDGKKILNVKGRSLESLLYDRSAQQTLNDTSPDPVWVITDTPAGVAEGMFDYIVRDSPFPPALDPGDSIPFLQPGSIFAPGTIPLSSSQIRWEQRPAPLHDAIADVCKRYAMGFRLVRNYDESELYFDVYAGNDLTTKQTVDEPVIFAPQFDNLQDVREFRSIKGRKNVAYVQSELGTRKVYAPGVDSTISGFDRQVMHLPVVFSTDNPPADVQAALEQAGKEALANRTGRVLFDGEVSKDADYIYGVDYQVGDLVEIRNQDGEVGYKRVTEQIFVSDGQGERSYPTLSQGSITDNDDWLAYSNDDTTWSDMTTEEWEDM